MATLTMTTGIVLCKREWREVDRLYSVFTSDYGKMELVGRGARKPLAKLSPHLEFASESEILVVHGRHMDTIASIERKKNFPGIYKDFLKTLLLHQSFTLLNFGLKPHQKDLEIYQMLHSWLSFLDVSPSISEERAGFLLAGFMLKLLGILGHFPELNNCLSCRRVIAEREFKWHALRGGVVCLECADKDSEQWFAAKDSNCEALKLVRFAINNSFEEQLRPRLSKDIITKFHDLAESLLIYHFPIIPPVSLRGAMACSISSFPYNQIEEMA